MGPSFFSSGGGEMCQRSAPSCGTSSQSGTSTPSLPLALASAEKSCTNQPAYVLENCKSLQKCLFVHLLPPHLNNSCLIRYLLPWSNESLPAMDVVHFLCCTPGFGFIIRGNCDSIFPSYCQQEVKGSDKVTQTCKQSFKKKKFKKKNVCLLVRLMVTFFIYSPVTVETPAILPGPTRWTVKLSWTSSLFSILHNTVSDKGIC